VSCRRKKRKTNHRHLHPLLQRERESCGNNRGEKNENLYNHFPGGGKKGGKDNKGEDV